MQHNSIHKNIIIDYFIPFIQVNNPVQTFDKYSKY